MFCKLILNFPYLLHHSPSYGYRYRFKYTDIESPIIGNINFDHLIIGISTLRLLFYPFVLKKYLLRIYFIINVPFFLYDLIYLGLAWRSLCLCLSICFSLSLSQCVCVCVCIHIYAIYKEHKKLEQGMFVCACDMCMLEGGLGGSCENKGD